MDIKEVKPNVFFGDAPESSTNVMFLKTSEGIVLIDTTTTVENMQNVMSLAGFVPEDVYILINTHADGDHIGGNSLFACPKYAHQKTYDRMKEAERTEAEMPTKTFDAPKFTLTAGEFTIELIYTGGHKPDQTILWLPEQKVLLASDLLFQGCYPWMQNCDARDWIAGLKSLHEFNAEVILPGHGTVSGYADVDQLVDYMETCLAIASAHKAKGSSLDDLLKDPAVPRPQGWLREQLHEKALGVFFEQA
ncbi:MAG: MBL fold metallo-hydrolase [Anaerolineales bacterium]